MCCFHCGKVIAGKQKAYLELLRNGVPAAKALTDVGLQRHCCRGVMLSSVSVDEQQIQYGEIFQPYLTPPNGKYIPRPANLRVWCVAR